MSADQNWEAKLYPDDLLAEPIVDPATVQKYANEVVKAIQNSPDAPESVSVKVAEYNDAAKAVDVFNTKFSKEWSAVLKPDLVNGDDKIVLKKKTYSWF